MTLPTPTELDAARTALGTDLLAVLPELMLCGCVVAMLFLRMLPILNRVHLLPVALLTAAGAFWVALGQGHEPRTLFGGLLIVDPFGGYTRLIILGSLTLLLSLCQLTRIPDREDVADFAALALGSTVGMLLMAQANHLLMVFIAVEMASLPSYALAGFMKGRTRSSEASLKYVIYGAASAGVMLYGISLLVAQTGTGSLTGVAARAEATPAFVTGLAFVGVGLAFKLAAVPFHFWCPDVFEGAAAEVGAFLSVASKAAALVLTARVAYLFADAFPFALTLTLGIAGALSATFGNLAAFGQSNLKRLLAYSTIAHAGYMLMGLSLLNQAGSAALLFYLSAYVLMNLGAFAAVAMIRNATGSEDLRDLGGLIRSRPMIVIALVVFLMSLLGLPPLAGFAAKFQLIAALWGGEPIHRVLVGVLAVNTVLSALYYLRIVKVMTLDEPAGEVPKSDPIGSLLLLLLALGVVALGVLWGPLSAAANLAPVTP